LTKQVASLLENWQTQHWKSTPRIEKKPWFWLPDDSRTSQFSEIFTQHVAKNGTRLLQS